MAEIRRPECGRRYQSKSGLRRHMKAEHPSTGSGRGGGGALTPALCQEGEGVTEAGLDTGSGQLGATQDARPEAERTAVERALVDLGIEWKDVISYRVHGDRVVIIEGPVGYKRTWWMPEARAEAGAEG